MGEPPAERRQPLRLEDLVLSLLCTAAGPLLWWFGTSALAGTPAGGGIQLVERTVATLCAGAGAIISLWWFLAVLGAALAAAGSRWRSAPLAHIGRRMSPAFLRRVTAAALGVNILLAPGAWASETVPAGGTQVGPAVSSAAAGQALTAHPGWLPAPRVSPSASTPSPETRPEPAGAPASGSLTSVLQQSPGDLGLPTPTWTPQTPAPATPGSTRTARPPAAEATTVSVRQGDCLWDIAAQELGPVATDLEIDRRWRQWHEHNRPIIGAEADLLVPGTVLTAPPFD